MRPSGFRFFSKIAQRFDYGSNSTLYLRMKDNKINGKIEALWDDWTDIEIDYLEGETPENHNLVIQDNQKKIEIDMKDSKKYQDQVRNIKLMIPEYSSLDMEFKGSIEQRDTNISSKMKGTLRIISDDTDPESKVIFKKVKTELSVIELNTSDLYFKGYWETKLGHLIKKGPGAIEIKRLGVSFDFQKEYNDTICKVTTVFTNPLCKEQHPDTEHRLQVKCKSSHTEYGMFRGSMDLEMEKNSYFKINDGSIDALRVVADKSTLEIYINEMNGPIDITLANNSRAIIRVNPEVEHLYRDSGLFKMKLDDSCKVDVSFEQLGGHLFGNLMKKYGVENVEEYAKYKKR